MDTDQKNGSRLNRTEILAALDYEIAAIEKEQASPGWTKWTFYGGFATLIWVAVAEFTKVDLTIVHAALVSLLCSVAIDLAEHLVRMVKPISARPSSMNRFRLSSTELGGSRLSLVGTALRWTGLLSIYYYLCHSSLQYVSSWFVWYYGIFLALLILVFILSYTGFPVNTRDVRPLWGKCVFHIATFVPLAMAVYQAGTKLLIMQVSLTATDIRLGLLATVFLWLLPVSLNHVAQSQPLLESLKNIRRDLAFDRIEAGAALRQADIALDGMRVDDYFQADLQKVLQFFDAASKSMRELQDRIREADSLIQSWEASPPSAATGNEPEPAKILRAIQESCDLHRKQIGEALDRGGSAAQAYYKKKPLFKFIVAKSEFERIETNIKSFIARLKEQSVSVSDQEKVFKERLKKVGEKSPHLLLPLSSEVKQIMSPPS